MASERNTFDVLGVRVDALTPEACITHVADAIKRGDRGYLVFCTVSSVLQARSEVPVGTALAAASLVTPDGMPLVWLGRHADVGPIERVYGPDFVLDFIGATGSAFSHYFYGGGPNVANAMIANLKRQFPDLRVAGSESPAFELNPLEVPLADIEEINRAEPDILWVGLGHPKQELFMHANQDRIHATIMAGVGAAFDFHSGRKREAPEWMKKSGLQWLHRLLGDPRRLWKRYLIGNSKFLLLLIVERFRRGLRRRHS